MKLKTLLWCKRWTRCCIHVTSLKEVWVKWSIKKPCLWWWPQWFRCCMHLILPKPQKQFLFHVLHHKMCLCLAYVHVATHRCGTQRAQTRKTFLLSCDVTAEVCKIKGKLHWDHSTSTINAMLVLCLCHKCVCIALLACSRGYTSAQKTWCRQGKKLLSCDVTAEVWVKNGDSKLHWGHSTCAVNVMLFCVCITSVSLCCLCSHGYLSVQNMAQTRKSCSMWHHCRSLGGKWGSHVPLRPFNQDISSFTKFTCNI